MASATRPLSAAMLASLIALWAPGSAAAGVPDPAEQPPFGGVPVEPLGEIRQAGPPPAGRELGPREVVVIAGMTEVVREEIAESPDARPVVYLRGECCWEVRYFSGFERGGPVSEGEWVAVVEVEDATGRVIGAFREHQVETKLARGYDGSVGGDLVNSWPVWVGLCILFVAPFFDPRRPWRLLHLDLLVLVSFSISQVFFNRGEITTSVPLVYPVIAYLFVRMAIAGLRPRPANGPLVPLVGVRVLAVIAMALLIGRGIVAATDGTEIDIGLAGVVGADRIADGDEIYDGSFTPPGIDLRGDTYGPANYLAYIPFEQAWPFEEAWDQLPAAHAASIAFDLLVVAGLFALGRRLRDGADGTALGVALAFAWLAYPYTLYAMAASANDALVAAAIVAALLALAIPRRPTAPAAAHGRSLASPVAGVDETRGRTRSAIGRGLAIGFGSAVKFGPLALAPLFAAGTGERRRREIAVFSAAFLALVAVVTLPLLPDGGLGEVYDRTFGYQASRGSPFSAWGLAPSLEPLQTVVRAGAVAIGVAVAFVPARRTVAQVAALGAAVVIATQAGSEHWFYFFTLWFLPLALVALFAGEDGVAPRLRRGL